MQPIATASEILSLFDRYSPLAWGRCGPASSSNIPLKINQLPHAVWRFKIPNKDLEAAIVEAVNSFQGKVEWAIYFQGRNWIIDLKKAKDLYEKGKFRTDTDARYELSIIEPELGKLAHEDLGMLVNHLEKYINLALARQKS